MKVAIVADDLTGALDAAAPFAKRGLDTRVVCLPDGIAAAARTPCDVLAVTTASRHLPAERAETAVAEACRVLVAAAPEVLFKKIDSTLRGNPVAESLAAARITRRRRVVFCPAAPSQGRTVRNGAVHVEGVPLSETAYARDALSPPSPDPLDVQVKRLAAGMAYRQVAVEEVWDDEGFLVADCATDLDLAAVAEQATADPAGTLLVGAVGLADAVAGSLYGSPVAPAEPILPDGTTLLFLVGSRAEKSRKQAAMLASRDGTLIHLAADAEIDAESIGDSLNGDVEALLVQPVARGGVSLEAELVAARLGAGAAALIANGHIGGMLVTGGDTLAAVLRALNAPTLTVVSELYPGIPLTRIDVGGLPLWVVSKAGGFGHDSLFTDLVTLFGRKR